MVTASFLTEDSYLGSIWGPLTLNRYNYCISSYPNYEDPSGNLPMLTPAIPSRIVPPDAVPETIREDIALLNFEVWMGAEYTRRAAGSFGKGVRDSITKAIMDKPFVSLLPWTAFAENLYNALHRQDFPNSMLGESQPLYHQWSPTEAIKAQLADNETKIQDLAGDIENKNAYYLGRCAGDIVVGIGGMLESFGGGMISMSGGVSLVPAALGGPTTTSVSITVTLAGVAITVDGAAQVVYACESLSKDFGRYQESRAEKADSDTATEPKEESEGRGSRSDAIIKNGRISIDDIKANPSAFSGKSAEEIAEMLRDSGYDVAIRDSTKSRSGAKIIQINNPGGGKNITQVQVSPGGGRHGSNPYVKISTSDQGIIKIVDGDRSTYKTDGTETAIIIFSGGN